MSAAFFSIKAMSPRRLAMATRNDAQPCAIGDF
jgi:hypothetical protein